jgi:hypothetical protein
MFDSEMSKKKITGDGALTKFLRTEDFHQNELSKEFTKPIFFRFFFIYDLFEILIKTLFSKIFKKKYQFNF